MYFISLKLLIYQYLVDSIRNRSFEFVKLTLLGAAGCVTKIASTCCDKHRMIVSVTRQTPELT